jgi:hypothetical protein
MGSSDAHREETVGVCYTEFPDTIRRMSDVVAAIRGRRTIPHERVSAGVAC